MASRVVAFTLPPGAAPSPSVGHHHGSALRRKTAGVPAGAPAQGSATVRGGCRRRPAPGSRTIRLRLMDRVACRPPGKVTVRVASVITGPGLVDQLRAGTVAELQLADFYVAAGRFAPGLEDFVMMRGFAAHRVGVIGAAGQHKGGSGSRRSPSLFITGAARLRHPVIPAVAIEAE